MCFAVFAKLASCQNFAHFTLEGSMIPGAHIIV